MLFCKAHVLSEWYFWVQLAKMVSVDNVFSCEAIANTSNSFCCDILLIFSRAGVEADLQTLFRSKGYK